MERKQLIFITNFLITLLLISGCLDANRNLIQQQLKGVISINHLLKIGGYYSYTIAGDSIAGLLLCDIFKEDETVYYSFMLSGSFFKKQPTKEEYRNAGLCGSLIPNSLSGSFITAFNKYAIAEKNLLPLSDKLKLIDKIPISYKNQTGKSGSINNFEELKYEFLSLEKINEQNRNMMKNLSFSIATFQTIDWDKLILATNDADLAKPHEIWRFSEKTVHPNAAQALNKDWIWNPIDDFSPFGSDDGSDAAYFFKDWRETHKNEEAAVCLDELEQRWNMSFAHKELVSEKEIKSLSASNRFYRNIDRSIIGVAFAQIALEGKISKELKGVGLKTIQRMLITIDLEDSSKDYKLSYSERLIEMKEIINKF